MDSRGQNSDNTARKGRYLTLSRHWLSGMEIRELFSKFEYVISHLLLVKQHVM